VSDIPAEAATDMLATFAALKARGRSLTIHVIAAKSNADAPWVIVDKASKANTRLRSALKVAKRGSHFSPQKRYTAGLVREGQRLRILLEDGAAPGSLGRFLGSVWPAALRGAQSTVEVGHLKKIGALLKAAEIDGAPEEDTPTVSEPDYSALSAEELEEIFGSDTRAVRGALPALGKLQGTIPIGPLDDNGAAQLKKAVSAVLSSSDPVDEVAAIVPAFVAMCATEAVGSAKVLKAGDALPLGDLAKTVGLTFMRFLDAMADWEDLLEQATDLGRELDTLEAQSPSGWDDEDHVYYTKTFSGYHAVRSRSETAQIHADSLYARLLAQFDAFTASTT